MTDYKFCIECGRPFEAIPDMAPHKRFCSTQCRNKFHYRKTKVKRAEKRAETRELLRTAL